MVKVNFIYQDTNLPSSRIRVLNLLPYIQNDRILATTQPYPKKIIDKIKLFFSLKNFDVVFLQKKLVTSIDLFFIKKFSKRLIFDFDDAIYINDDRAKNFKNKSKEIRFINIIKASDAVIAGNPILARKAQEFNKRVFILPSAVFTENIPLKTKPREASEPLILGWVGGGSNLHHLNMITPALKRLSKLIPFKLRVISNMEFRIDGIPVENIKWDINTQDKEISLFDAGLMPIPKNPWTEGKCSYKALQYMSAGVVPVATRFGFNCHVIDNRIDGFLFDTEEEFVKIIEFIYENPQKAFEMGKKAREKVIISYSVNVISKKLAEILINLCN